MTASPRKSIRSYVLRQGRMTAAQRHALEHLWGAYGVEPRDDFVFEKLFESVAPLTVEIGFGMGDSLLAMAAREAERNFLGIEVHRPGVGHLLMGIHENEVSNLRIINGDAQAVLQHYFAADSVNRIQIFFPDPWPKKKHYKRRLISRGFLELAAHVLEPGGLLHLATDWAQYAEEIITLLDDHENFIAATPPYRAVTKYEARGLKLGHKVFDIAYGRR